MSRVRVLSYNVRYDNRDDSHDAWYARRGGVADLVRFHRPDLVAFQEPVAGQRHDLDERLSDYDLVGEGREGGDEGEGCPIGVRTDRWRVVADGTFWLSETPTEPSTGWGAAHPRVTTWARVRPRAATDDGVAPADAPLVVANTHFDHMSARARRESARLLAERLPDIAAESAAESTRGTEDGVDETPLVLVGDLNCTAGSDPYRILTGSSPAADGRRDDADTGDNAADTDGDAAGQFRDAAGLADIRHGPRTSLTDFTRLIAGRRIDHVLVAPGVDVEAFGTLADRDDRGRYPSDHLPVLARLRL
ncbi:MAG: metal-dependent hydrolase [uncultured archaeon A07HR67]|nr:MAG: metal-dependent hydrolase [uncultured archaeon A07HR67]